MEKSNIKLCKLDCEVITVQCPVCSEIKRLEIPKSTLNDSKPVSSISIREGLVCGHSFLIFLDNHFKVRGYQKIDSEFSPSNKLDDFL